MAPERDLGLLLGSIGARLHPGVFVFCEVPSDELSRVTTPVLSFSEGETTTVVVSLETARDLQLQLLYTAAWITLEATSDLEAIGFLAVVSSRLATAGISVNVVSGCRHDHLFVPVGKAAAAMNVLHDLESSYRSRPLEPAGSYSDAGAFSIRPALPADAESLMWLWTLCGLRFNGASVMSELESCSLSYGELVLVVIAGEQAIGSLWATYDGRRGWLQRVAIHPRWQGLGLGASLVVEAERRLMRLGARRSNLLVEPDNAAVASFYRTRGYEPEDLLFMTRRLPEPERTAERLDR